MTFFYFYVELLVDYSIFWLSDVVFVVGKSSHLCVMFWLRLIAVVDNLSLFWSLLLCQASATISCRHVFNFFRYRNILYFLIQLLPTWYFISIPSGWSWHVAIDYPWNQTRENILFLVKNGFSQPDASLMERKRLEEDSFCKEL